MHANTPRNLKVKIAETIRAGFGHPKLYNDEAAIAAIMAKGHTLEEARNYAIVGCVEMDTPGLEFGWHDAAYMNTNKVFELSLNGGKCVDCDTSCHRYAECAGAGLKLGPDTGSLAEFKSIEAVMESYDRQMEYWTDQMASGIEVMDHVHRDLKPTPYVSMFISDCIAEGKDLTAGGARYNHTGPQATGIATVADGLSAISQLVFDEKYVSGSEFADALSANWEGHEALYAMVNSSKVHHYGNDDDYADRFAEFTFNTYCKHIENRINARGGTYTPGVYTVSANVPLGMIQGATADGRKAGEAISDNMGPVHTAASSHDMYGPTAVVNSVTKMDHCRATNGTLLNWKIPPECISGEAGRDNLINLIDTFFAKKGMHSQFIVVSSDQMRKAQKEPKAYKDMLVRVAGYSAYFVDLSTPLQEDLIGRTDISFE
jgi:formate C-acetyltransferase